MILSFMLAVLISVATTWVLSELRHQRDQIYELQRIQERDGKLEDNRAAEFRERLKTLEREHGTP